jgi:hypothetical protein
MSLVRPIKRVQDVFYFLIGFLIGFLLFFLFTQNYHVVLKEKIQSKLIRHVTFATAFTNASPPAELYETEMADKLFSEVKILCWIFTHPDNLKTKVPHVMQTWGKKCNTLLFMSTEKDPNNPNVIALPVENGRAHLWNKTKLTMQYVYEHHINDHDWFIRADDDK